MTEQKALPAQRLYIDRAYFKGVRGIEEVTVDLGQITVIEARNGDGKSSFLAGLRCVCGIDRTNLSNLATIKDKATGERTEDVEGVVHFSGAGIEIRVSRKGNDQPKVAIKNAAGEWKDQPRPIEFLRDLIDPEGANPGKLNLLKEEDLATVVLEAMPLPEYSRPEAFKRAGVDPSDIRIPPSQHPLDEIALIEEHLTNVRRATGQQRDLEQGQAEKILKDLPAEVPEHPAEELAKVAAARDELHQQVAAALGEIESKLSAAKEAAQTRHALRLAELNAELERARAEAHRVASEEIATAGLEAANEATTIDDMKTDLAAYDQRLAALREADKGFETDRRMRSVAAEAKGKGEALAARYKELTAALSALSTYKMELGKNLPVRGLEVRIDEKGKKRLLIDGVNWPEVNTARRLEACGEISLVRGKEPTDGRPYAPIILIDDGQAFDEDARKVMLRSIKERGSQVVMAVATAGAWRTLRDEEATR